MFALREFLLESMERLKARKVELVNPSGVNVKPGQLISVWSVAADTFKTCKRQWQNRYLHFEIKPLYIISMVVKIQVTEKPKFNLASTLISMLNLRHQCLRNQNLTVFRPCMQTYYFHWCDLLTLWIGKSKSQVFQQVAGSHVRHLNIVYNLYSGLIFLHWLCDVYLWGSNPTTWNITILISSLFWLSGYIIEMNNAWWQILVENIRVMRFFKWMYLWRNHNALTLTSDFKVM